MPDQGLITAYQRARQDLNAAKTVLQNACDAVNAARIPLVQAWLDECYSELHAKVEDTSDEEFSMRYLISIPTMSTTTKEQERKRDAEIYDKLMQYLQGLEEQDKNK
jgi:hypothetical protein